MIFLRRCFVAGLIAAAGCQNNTIELEEDDGTGADPSSTGSADGIDDGRPTTGATVMDTGLDDDDSGSATIEDGWWLMAVDTPLSRGVPFQFLVQVQQASPGAYSIALQPLSLDIGSTTTPRQPVGEVRTIGGLLSLGNGAPLQFYTGLWQIPGAANPITGSDLEIDIYVDGMQIGDPYCGIVSGSVLSPIAASLDGTTFATVRLAATDPASLPVDFPTACP